MMLRIFLTVSVLFGHQIAARETEQEVIDLCKDTDCLKPEQVIQYKDYDEIEFPHIQWAETTVNFSDLETDLEPVMEISLDKLFNYAFFCNADETIVPLTAPWGLTGYLVNQTFPETFYVGVGIVPEVRSMPEPIDQTIELKELTPGHYFVKTYHEKFEWEEYKELALDFLKELEEEKGTFEWTVAIIWYKKSGLKQIWLKQGTE
ncbi:uncharacterized protein LOC132836358 [Hemiscyllium ocellatum]|uniref:uncharacterized protein LOC132836358 n=1 Tax=Hemiscyllium ocellatum TaxID=170820 RepID=UPI0029676C00|nr:uncharacterized protein LOC132836358 [Hemiscyllium ocellatum]